MENGGGGANARGIRFQNLCALDYALRELECDDSRITAISVESRRCPSTGTVFHELDFSLLADDAPVVDAQVKSGTTPAAYSLPGVWRELWRLTGRNAEEYLLVTNRRPARTVLQLAELLTTHRGSHQQFVEALSEVCAGVRGARAQITSASPDRLDRLRRTRLVLSTDDIDSLQEHLRDRIRVLRHCYRKGSGTRSTGLVFRNVLDLIADRAADPHDVVLSLNELGYELGADERAVAEALSERDWDVHAGLAPVIPDVARPDLLDSISRCLTENPDYKGIPCGVLFGLSGIGKTSLAASWAAEHAYEFDRVFWATAQDPVSLRRSFLMIEDALLRWTGQTDSRKPRSNGSEDVRQRVHRLLSACPGPWLIVFDNATDAKVVQPWIPRRGWGRALITTIEQGRWHGNGITAIEVLPMKRGQAIELLGNRLLNGSDDPTATKREQLDRLSAFMCDWPLGLELAAAYLSSTDAGVDGIDRYTAEVGIRQRSLADAQRGPRDYEGSLVGAIELAADRMEDFPRADLTSIPDAIAETMIYLAAYVDEHQIPLQLLIVAAVHDAAVMAGVAAGVLRRLPVEPHTTHGEILRSVVRFSLVRRDQDIEWLSSPDSSASNISIHMNKIVQQTMRERIIRLDPTREKWLFRQMTHHITEWLRYSQDNHESMHSGTLLNHALAVSKIATERNIENKYVINLQQSIGACANSTGNSRIAQSHLQRALTLTNRVQPEKTRLRRFQLHLELAASLVAGGSRYGWNEESFHHLKAAVRELDAVADINPEAAASFAAMILTFPTIRLGQSKPEVTEVIKKLRRFKDQIKDGVDFFNSPDVPYDAALRRGDFATAASVCERALQLAPSIEKEQELLAMAILPLERMEAWDRILPLLERLLTSHVRLGRLYPSTGIELMRAFGPICVGRSLMSGEDPRIKIALGSLVEMIPILRKQAHKDVGLDFLAVIEAAHAFLQGDVEKAGNLIAAVPQGGHPDPVEELVWHGLRGSVENMVRNSTPQ
ncbi:hypothetical protein SAMN04488074_101894 [Lentzea albidocapillata subsp. violacea]|uniref:NB-ARC domain-containing protein n=1 Tax=Lentzea albidocapillata subsp. violacea TaxID=128104 RepID=A0A1G8S752_9PSEU|nr:ATP-binding protein [Lentzea albidocapillata]SDJ25068.1 hypothetical protein SAMN04488074_101894 [Lentzea albidocapillata subsp. violacea]